MRALLDRMGSDPDSRSVSVVDCGSRDNLPDYIKLLDQLKIQLIAVTDGDRATCARDEKTREKVGKVADAAGDRAVRFREDIETALGTTKRGRDNSAHLVSVAETLDMDALPPEIAVLRDRIAQVCPVPAPSAAPTVT